MRDDIGNNLAVVFLSAVMLIVIPAIFLLLVICGQHMWPIGTLSSSGITLYMFHIFASLSMYVASFIVLISLFVGLCQTVREWEGVD